MKPEDILRVYFSECDGSVAMVVQMILKDFSQVFGHLQSLADWLHLDAAVSAQQPPHQVPVPFHACVMESSVLFQVAWKF